MLAIAVVALLEIWMVYISIPAVTAAYGFALTASPFLQTPKKEPKTLAPPLGASPRLGMPERRH
ncbi:hypothetical protein CXP47_11895 [Pseudomonas chlororaphis]|nr:hypothetical protein CXP47_11895 [Pseudomonas chlororaphis]